MRMRREQRIMISSEKMQQKGKENRRKSRRQKMKRNLGKRQMRTKERQRQSKKKKIPKDSRKMFVIEEGMLIIIFLLKNEY